MRIQQVQYRGQPVDAGGDILFFCRGTADENILRDIEEAFSDEKTAIAVPRIVGKESFYVDPVTREIECMDFDGFAIKTGVFNAVGGIDRRLGEAGATDLLWRVKGEGYKAVYLPLAVMDGKSGAQSYEKKVLESLLMRCKHGRFSDVWQGEKLILKALKHPGIYGVSRASLFRRAILLFPRAVGCFLKRNDRRECAFFDGVDFGFSRGTDMGERPKGAPRVSLIVRTYKRSERLKRTLESLRNQTYENFEVVIVEDDAPHLGELLAEFGDLDINYIALGENKGRAAAGNVGFNAAKGVYLNLLDDDDYLFPEYLETAVAAMENKRVDIVFSRAIALKIDAESESPYRFRVRDRQLMDFPRIDIFSMVRQCLTASNGVLFKKELLEQSGGMRPELKGHEDWSLWLRLMARGKWVVQPFATCCFTVPYDVRKEQLRLEEYAENDALLLEDDALIYQITGKELKEYYENAIHGLTYLKQLGRLDEYIDNEYKKATREE